MWRCLVSFFIFQLVAADLPEVTIGSGRLRGFVMETINGRKFDAFMGIPYAKPPVGQLRFAPAEPVDPWTGVWNANFTPVHCLQLSYMTYNTPNEMMGDEDCLYINVFSPKVPGPNGNMALLDVLVSIHGGGFHWFSGADYGPDYILDRDIVLVSFNYRLGSLGFLGFEDDVLPGNNGLFDQLLALKWVKENIAAFGGDPQRITVTGMSAGAASVEYHILSKKSRGLFQKAILNAGAVSNPWAQSRHIRENSLRLTAELGCPTDDTRKALECLRQKSAKEIVEAVKIFKVYSYWPTSPISPSIGPLGFIDKQPYDAIKSGDALDIPILWTFVNDEGQFPGGELLADKSGAVDQNWNLIIPFILGLNESLGASSQACIAQKVKEHYIGDKKIRENPKGLTTLVGERFMYNGLHGAAKLHAEYTKSPNWVYRFSYNPSIRVIDFFHIDDIYKGGACHGDDTHLVLKAYYADLDKNAEDRKMIKYLIDIWMNFIQGAMPSDWPTVKSGLPNLALLDIVSPEAERNVYKIEEMTSGQKLWQSFALPENSAELINSSRDYCNL